MNYDSIPKLEVNFKELASKFPVDNYEPFILKTSINDVPYEFFVHLKQASEKILFFGNGAINSEQHILPVFQRLTWTNDITSSVIIYNDPTLYLGKINLGWLQGSENDFYMEKVAEIIKLLLNALSTQNEDVIFYGSSAGGFMSLYLAGLLKGTRAIVNNPQIDVTKYYATHVNKMFELSYVGMSREEILKRFNSRLSIVDFYKSINYIPEIYYMQNLECKHDIQNHLTTFINELELYNKGLYLKNVMFDFYYDRKMGHNPKEKIETLNILNAKAKNWIQSKNHIINNFSTKQIIKITDYNSTTIEIANSLLKDEMFFFKNFDRVEFPKGIDWDYEHDKNPGSYQLYLHALNCVSVLLNAYEKTNNAKYFIKANEIIESWIEFDKTANENKMIWYDHPTAYRAHNLVYFILIAQKHFNIQLDNYIDLVYKHALYLYKDENYRKNNHGIMMDRSIIMLGKVLNANDSDRWIEKGIWRLKDTFLSSYSFNGVHLENSPEYHIIVFNLYKSIEQFLNKNDLTLGSDVLNMLSKSEKYFMYLAKPDNTLPLIGDSGKHSSKIEKRYDSFFDQTAGISILQYKNETIPENSTWIAFIAGYGTVTHKHCDDLSLNIFYNGKDILVDSGKYGYGSSKIRGYVLSPEAHSSISLKGKKYKFDLTADDHKNIYTKNFYTSEKMDIVTGVNNAYPNIDLKRTIVFIKPNIVVLIDEIKAEKAFNIVQNFNLAPHITTSDFEGSKIRLMSDEDPIEIEQFRPFDSAEIIKGSEEEAFGIIAEKFGQVYPTHQIKFNVKATSKALLTVIKLGKEAINSFNHIDLDLNNRMLTIEIDKQSIQYYI